MGKVKYSAIIGSLGQTYDRFMPSGYKDPKLDAVEFRDVIKSLEKMKVLKGADLYQAPTGALSDPDTVNEILRGAGFEASSVLPLVFGERRWSKGSLSACDGEVRKAAMALVKQNIDFNAKLVGNPSVDLWLGQDGWDYPLQTDYKKQWTYLVDNIRQLADYNPKIKLTLEGKIGSRATAPPSTPRRRRSFSAWRSTGRMSGWPSTSAMCSNPSRTWRRTSRSPRTTTSSSCSMPTTTTTCGTTI